MQINDGKSACVGCLAGCRQDTRADGPPPQGLNAIAVGVYGLPLAVLIVAVVVVERLALGAPLLNFLLIALALLGVGFLVIASGRSIQARLKPPSDPVRILK